MRSLFLALSILSLSIVLGCAAGPETKAFQATFFNGFSQEFKAGSDAQESGDTSLAFNVYSDMEKRYGRVLRQNDLFTTQATFYSAFASAALDLGQEDLGVLLVERAEKAIERVEALGLENIDDAGSGVTISYFGTTSSRYFQDASHKWFAESAYARNAKRMYVSLAAYHGRTGDDAKRRSAEDRVGQFAARVDAFVRN